ncbi:hypothetical protein DZF83_23180 [Vibrio parahaemolyticus]|nr:hypothetical protein [Vibrio parahaemolyticus]
MKSALLVANDDVAVNAMIEASARVRVFTFIFITFVWSVLYDNALVKIITKVKINLRFLQEGSKAWNYKIVM